MIILNHLILTAAATAFFVLLIILCHRGAKRYENCCTYAEIFCNVLFTACVFAALGAAFGGFVILLEAYTNTAHAFTLKTLEAYDSIAAWFAIPALVYALERAKNDWSKVWRERKTCTLNVVVYMLYLVGLLYAQVTAIFTV